MSRSLSFDHFARLLRIARYCENEQVSTAQGLTRLTAAEGQSSQRRLTRRDFLGGVGKVAAAGVFASVAQPVGKAFTPRGQGAAASVGIVGAGLAGLACADELKRNGINAALYDASTRAGGRCFSLSGFFPGQVAERGGEFIDNLHKTMLGYAQRFKLEIEDVNKRPGEVFYFFGGQHYAEAVVVDEFRDSVAAMRADLRALSDEVTADTHTDTDVRLDRTNLLEYLEGRNGAGLAAGPVVKQAIVEAYEAEYGLAAEEQSCLNFLLFIHADKRSKFSPFGIFSDERWHVVAGNERIVEHLGAGLATRTELGMRLVRVRQTSAGRIELTFRRGRKTLSRFHDAVVLTLPFTVLRTIELDLNLGLTPEKRAAIDLLGYGTNAKMMVGFASRPRVEQGSTGASYSDLPNHQATWETNPARATAARAVLTDYSSGPRGAGLNPRDAQTEAARFLNDVDLVYPGALAAATRKSGQFVVHLEHWPSNELSQGSYTCYRPGQFTTIAGLEGRPVGNLHFAGEHTNSFYEWQGFMEGAALSGLQAAEILQDIKVGTL